jgi:hypothetical protein
LGWKLTIRGLLMPFRAFGSHVCCSVDFMFIYKSVESFVLSLKTSASNINTSREAKLRLSDDICCLRL